MKWRKVVTVFFTVLGLIASDVATARGRGHFHGHSRIGIFIGVPLLSAWYYSYPSVVTTVSSAPVYIEQMDEQVVTQTPPDAMSNYWYYCNHPDGYYPYIRTCPGGWQTVEP